MRRVGFIKVGLVPMGERMEAGRAIELPCSLRLPWHHQLYEFPEVLGGVQAELVSGTA